MTPVRRILLAMTAAMGLIAGPAHAQGVPEPYSETYRKVDRSFSDIAVDTPFSAVRDRLTVIPRDGCEEWGDCDWRDADGVSHYFWSDGDSTLMVVKQVKAADFAGRPIGALGIGMARTRADVIANVRAFLPGVKISCDQQPSGNVGPVECDGGVDPGWFQIGFDERGNLLAIRFDAYQFT